MISKISGYTPAPQQNNKQKVSFGTVNRTWQFFNSGKVQVQEKSILQGSSELIIIKDIADNIKQGLLKLIPSESYRHERFSIPIGGNNLRVLTYDKATPALIDEIISFNPNKTVLEKDQYVITRNNSDEVALKNFNDVCRELNRIINPSANIQRIKGKMNIINGEHPIGDYFKGGDPHNRSLVTYVFPSGTRENELPHLIKEIRSSSGMVTYKSENLDMKNPAVLETLFALQGIK